MDVVYTSKTSEGEKEMRECKDVDASRADHAIKSQSYHAERKENRERLVSPFRRQWFQSSKQLMVMHIMQ
jgi:hypothetical protein